MKHINIFTKVLMLMTIAFVIVIIVSYLLLYFLLPSFYRKHEFKRYEKLLSEAVEEACSRYEYSSENEIFLEFAEKNNVDLILYDENGNTIFDFYKDYSVTTNIELNENENNVSQSINMGETEKNSDEITLTKTYEMNSNERTVEIIISLEQLDEVKAVVVEICPIAFACCVIFAIFAAAVISNLFVKPIQKMNYSVQKMTEMDADAHIDVKTYDEIGRLSKNINFLYHKLRGTIETLGQELAKNQKAENQKIDFLRTVSHELKNPLAAADALVEGMIYDVPPYNKNQKEYLIQCKGFLEKAGELTKESLQFSKFNGKEDITCVNLKEIIKNISDEYILFINAKQIQYIEEISENITVQTNIKLFSKALSNIFSNAVSYSAEKGIIHVYTKEKDCDGVKTDIILIENSCEPISTDILEQLFKKPYKASSDNPNSTGLGLYIVNQILNLLHMKYCFSPSEEANGMVFKIEIPQQEK